MAIPLASWADFLDRNPDQDTSDQVAIEAKLAEASRKVRAKYRTIDARIAAEDLDPDFVADVVCRMVLRAVSTPADLQGVTQASMTTGPFTQNLTYANTDGRLYFTKEDRRDLEPPRGGPFTSQMWG